MVLPASFCPINAGIEPRIGKTRQDEFAEFVKNFAAIRYDASG
jgi:hypothetical protein